MIVILGESGSGKTTIANELSKRDIPQIITYTTRPMRDGEVDGKDYHFISEEEFIELNKDGFFAETATYNNWHYGSAKEDYDDNLKSVILTPHGLRQVKKNGLDIVSFYIKVPRRDRLIRMLRRGDNIEECYRRNLSDVGQFDGIEDEVDFVINCTEETTKRDMVYTILEKYRN